MPANFYILLIFIMIPLTIHHSTTLELFVEEHKSGSKALHFLNTHNKKVIFLQSSAANPSEVIPGYEHIHAELSDEQVSPGMFGKFGCDSSKTLVDSAWEFNIKPFPNFQQFGLRQNSFSAAGFRNTVRLLHSCFS